MIWTPVSIFGLSFLIGIINGDKHPRILNGDDVEIKFYPYQVSIRIYGKHNCGGAIITEKHIITAAHCIHDNLKNHTTVHSATTRSDKIGNKHIIERMDVHPEWMESGFRNHANDIAIITLKDPMKFDKYQNKINLPTHEIRDHQIAHVTGWGDTKTGGEVSKNLKKIRVELLTSDTCKPLSTNRITKKQICSFKAFGIGVCNGDSGGPLVSEDELVGIVSLSDDVLCAHGGPDVYTYVYHHQAFIEAVLYY